MQMPHRAKKNHIIKTAYEVFKKESFHATSMDFLIKEADVSRRTMYKYFNSKNALIVEVLKYYKEDYKSKIDEALTKANPAEQYSKIYAVTDCFLRNSYDQLYHGCLAVYALAEFSDSDRDILKACLDFKDWQLKTLKDAVRDKGFDDPELSANELFVMIEGLTITGARPNHKNLIDVHVFLDKIIRCKH